MELSKQIAEKIVTEVNSIIPQRINLMDPRGIIIASSDPVRVGTFHEGARMIVSEGLPEVIVYEDGEYEGARRGLNYPIVMDGRILGVLGITGVYEQIVDSARIIQRMTELLLSEANHAEQRLVGESVRNRYLDEWLNGDPKNLNPVFVERGLALNMDISIPRRVMVCCAYDAGDGENWETLHQINAAEQMIKQQIVNVDRNNLFLKAASNVICLVTLQRDDEMERLARTLLARVETEYRGLHLAIGIDDHAGAYGSMHNNCVKAQRALAACMRTHKWSIRKYGELNMEVFADEVDTVTKQEYIRKIMRGFTDDEIARTLPMLEVLYDNEGSISRTADQLFLHKNTLQYKLRRIAERTGYDPRSVRHSSLFYIAIYFYREIRDTMRG